ncbi:transcriptional regulator [Acrocarpospora corrugata]|uniref:Transcriptional regulator n=1 Tax=Acrocarpospora corrugata TaxID=35763 RepID=A0A5M3W6F7_9ACTN|nr:helix-turn-helix transcriptional regulator [Acrocarpospora corrugata]GES03889.1 transcriptional regulator [Acrocarpospora corrugata]
MKRSDALGEFLRSRRARLTPPDVGLPWRANGRRVAGLRREELALAAGVSVDYYTRLEQGRVGNVSDQVLDAVGGVLRLTSEERRHLRELIRTRPGDEAEPWASGPIRARAALRMMVDILDPVPAILVTGVLDVVAVNRTAKMLIHDFEAMPRAERNMVRWTFLDPGARTVFPDWEQIAADSAAWLRSALGRATDSRPQELVDDLLARSDYFARCWADHHVTYCTHGTKRFRHPAVGTMSLNWESFTPTADPDLYLLVYTAATGSPSAEKLAALPSRALENGQGKSPSSSEGRQP